MHIEDRHWHSSQEYSEADNGSLILELQVGLSPELISWIFSWNEYVDVLSPPELIETMSKKVNRIKKKYPAT